MNSIFEFAKEFNIESQFGNWQVPPAGGFVANAVLNLPFLFDFLRSNLQQNDSISFNHEKFRPSAKGPGIPLIRNTDGILTRKGDVVKISCLVNKKVADLNFARKPGVGINFKEGKISEYTLNFYYTNPTSIKKIDTHAIIMIFDNYEDFEYAYQNLGLYLLPDSENDIRKAFATAFTEAAGNPQRLDWLYQEVPSFILFERDDDIMFSDLKLLLTTQIDSDDTNENIAIINLLRGLSPDYFYNKMQKDPTIARKLINKFSESYIGKLVEAFSLLGVEVWKQKDYDNALYFNLQDTIQETFSGNEEGWVSFCYYQEKSKTFEIGNWINFYSRGIREESYRAVAGIAGPYDPVIIVNGKEEIVVPALVCEYFTNKKAQAYARENLSLMVSTLMPEIGVGIFRKAITSTATTVGQIRSVQKLIDYLAEIREGFRAVDLDKAGIKALFRGTTKNAEGMLWQGNPNSIKNGFSTSTDPIVATIFGTESASAGRTKGFLQILLPKNMKAVTLNGANTSWDKELEVILQLNAENISPFVVKEIPIEAARGLVKKIYNVEISPTLSFREARDLIVKTQRLTLKESYRFYREINKLKL
jgi:hypothetical protein